MRILARFQGGTQQQLKYTYMQIVEDFEKPEEVMTNRLKLRRYLRELILNQTRLFTASQEIKKAQESQEAPNTPNIPSDLIKYYQALDTKLQVSDTPYFDSSDCPKKNTDLLMYCKIVDEGNAKHISPELFPHLFAWFHLIARFSDKIKGSWME